MMQKTPPKVSGQHLKPVPKTEQSTKQRVMTKLELITLHEDAPGKNPTSEELKQNYNALLQDLEDFQDLCHKSEYQYLDFLGYQGGVVFV